MRFKQASQTAEVAFNTAAILREDALLLKKQEKEFAILKEYESDLHDCSAFYEWQSAGLAGVTDSKLVNQIMSW